MDSFRTQLQANAAQWMSRTASTAPNSKAKSRKTCLISGLTVRNENAAAVVPRAPTVVSGPSVTAAVDAQADQDESKNPPTSTNSTPAGKSHSPEVKTGVNMGPALKVDPGALQVSFLTMSRSSTSQSSYLRSTRRRAFL